uniref:Uncharacterized protein n=1 Tax=Anguilla anguilla TaxID=7936 RepID=A0A0E9TKW4_ANGAN
MGTVAFYHNLHQVSLL